MSRVLAFLISCLLVVAPLLPVRADAGQSVMGQSLAGQVVTLCADGMVQQVVLDANGNPIPPCLLGDHCAECVILSVPALVDPVMLARPVRADSRLVPVMPPIRASLARLPAAQARAPPFPVL